MKPTPADVRWIFEKLRKVDFLTYHSEEEMVQLVQAMGKLALPAGATIIRQGESGKDFYLIRSGKVAVWAETPEGRKPLATLQDGDSFGEVSILTGEVCNATVTADSPVELFSLPPRSVRDVVKGNPLLAEKMADAILQRKGVRALGLEPESAGSRSMLERIRGFFGITA